MANAGSGSLSDEGNARSTITDSVGTGGHEWEIVDGVVIKSSNIGFGAVIVNVSHVATSNSAVGASVHERMPVMGKLLGVGAYGVGNRGGLVISCGRRHLGRLTGRPAGMSLAHIAKVGL